MKKEYKVGGYVKLAKLWERSRDAAIAYHNEYYRSKFQNDPKMCLCDVYIDITGNKEIRRRKQMLRLLGDCMAGKINCIATQTRAYLAANNEEFFHLIHLLFSLEPSIEIVTEDLDYNIDTIRDEDDQRDAMKKMAADYVNMNPATYKKWKDNILRGIETQQQEQSKK